MTINLWGIQSPSEPAEPGDIVTGIVGGHQFVGLLVNDGRSGVVVLAGGGSIEAPSLINFERAEAAKIVGQICIEPLDATEAYRLPDTDGVEPGALLLGRDGEIAVYAHVNRQRAAYSFKTGLEATRTGNMSSHMGWRIMVYPSPMHPGYEVARFGKSVAA